MAHQARAAHIAAQIAADEELARALQASELDARAPQPPYYGSPPRRAFPRLPDPYPSPGMAVALDRDLYGRGRADVDVYGRAPRYGGGAAADPRSQRLQAALRRQQRPGYQGGGEAGAAAGVGTGERLAAAPRWPEVQTPQGYPVYGGGGVGGAWGGGGGGGSGGGGGGGDGGGGGGYGRATEGGGGGSYGGGNGASFTFTHTYGAPNNPGPGGGSQEEFAAAMVDDIFSMFGGGLGGGFGGQRGPGGVGGAMPGGVPGAFGDMPGGVPFHDPASMFEALAGMAGPGANAGRPGGGGGGGGGGGRGGGSILGPLFAQMFRGGFGGGGDDNRSYEDWLSFIDSQTGGASNRGATEEEINALPTETVHRRPRRRGSSGAGPSSSSSSSPSAAAAAAGVDEADKCAICLGEFEPGTVVKRLPCTHVFCDGCISQWLAINKECPCCKASIRDGTRS